MDINDIMDYIFNINFDNQPPYMNMNMNINIPNNIYDNMVS